MRTPEESSRPLVILNPAANRGHMGRHRALVCERVEREQAEYIETTRPGEARERAELAAREGRPVIVVGGDGSVHEVVNGLLAAGRRVPLGIIAAGTGNDFAQYALKLPMEPEPAIERAFDGRLVDIDAGVVNGCYFVNSFGVGLDADIALATERMKKWPLMNGSRLYYTAALRQLIFGYHRCPWLTVSMDEEIESGGFEKRYVLIAVTIGPSYGAGFRINPFADPADGLFDICAIHYTPWRRALTLLPTVQRGEHADLPEVTFYHARRIRIEGRRMVNALLDGETTCAQSYHAEILPGALWIRV
ncbi:MAG: diacylglycerol kinase family lipid kinase [Ktedonobacteraceae bacterium]|nr:diacylglycerol kinase family lipid kinase [Ktedonobacteraceae bacterium]